MLGATPRLRWKSVNRVEGRDGFLDGAQGLRRVVRGHRLLRQWQDFLLEYPCPVSVCGWRAVLFRDNQRLNDLNDVRANTINSGSSGRDLDARQNEQASNLRLRIKAERASLGLRAADEQDQPAGTDNSQLINNLATLIQTLNALPAKIGVG